MPVSRDPDLDALFAEADPEIEFLLGGTPRTAQAYASIDGPFNREAFECACTWIIERRAIQERREAGRPKPWTDTAIMRDTRWCNVRRWDDKTSRWLARHWYDDEPLVSHAQIAANAALGRLVNRIEGLEDLRAEGLNVAFDRATAQRVLHARNVERGKPTFTGAYIVSQVDGRPKWKTVPEQVDIIFREHDRLLVPSSMQETVERISHAVRGVNSFSAGQMVADLRHVYPGAWADRHDWAPMGPGSQRGVAWLRGWDGKDETAVKRLAPAKRFLSDLRQVRDQLYAVPDVRAVLERVGAEMMDIQNVLCETDKYNRLLTGTGKAKNKYPGR